MRSKLSTSLVLALAYALAGWLSLKLAVPPGYAAPVFPPAGIALSALLIFGIEAWPGVFAGSLIVQAIASHRIGFDEPSWIMLVAPAGATVQAIAGALLARRLVGFPNALDTPSSIVRFLGIVAPASCLINASLSVPALLWSGIVPAGGGFFNWWNWWLGDTLGVMLASPLMFVFLGEPRDSWRPRRTAVALPLCVAIALTGVVFEQLRRSEDARIATQFARDAENLASLVKKRLESQIDMLLAIERFIALNEHVSRGSFREFVAPMLARYPGTQNFSWNPRVVHAERARFEAAVAATDRPDFGILDRAPGATGATIPARDADEYVPILFVEPLAGNLPVVGFNPLSIPAAAAAIEATRHDGRPAVSAGFRLTQETGEQRGVVVYQAVFGPAGGRATAGSDSTAAFLGLVSGAFRMDDALAATLANLDALSIELCLVDLDGAPSNHRLSGPRDCDADAWLRADTSAAFPLPFAGRHWEIRLRGNARYAAELRSWTAWGAIAVGLFATGILGAFLLVTTGHTRRISRVVDERTAQLAAAGSRLREQQAALARAQRVARMGSWEIDVERQSMLCSDELRNLLDLSDRNDFAIDDLIGAVAEPDRQCLRDTIEILSNEPGSLALDCRLREAPRRVVHFLIESEWRAGHAVRVRGTVQDVTAAREAEAHIQHLAHYDSLTGLPNRSLWITRARSALQSAQRHGDALAVLFLDLDQFKTINDSLGHPVGDRLLAAVAHRLSGSIRDEDVLARIGGNEFVALLPRLARPDDAASVARKMLDLLAKPLDIDGHELTPSVSIGIALYPADGSDVDTLLKHADIAMYSAKDAGRGNFQFFVPEMNARAFERLVLESGLRRAIERNELTLHYQPQVDAFDKRIVGVEALVRWNHPEMGLVMPNQFVPVAEDSGLIVPLGVWVLREACRQQARWREAGRDALMVAINISALQFRRNDFVETVQQALAQTGADPHCIELEITESALMQPSDALFERPGRLVAMGLTLALDDFGTGYSSLAYLKRLPIARLKLDRSFVKDLPGDAEDAAIASATLSLARDLGMEVVAEGVESAAQRDYLKARGCRLMQGFLFARPLTASDLEARLSARLH